MGVRGLSTFIQQYHSKYNERVYLHDCPIVIDGCNLMFFLYCEGRNALPSISSSSTGNRKSSSRGGSPLSKSSPLKRPHLFGGDYLTYAQNVREFFQHLKLCNITAIVLFDGAYDSLKIKTALKRFSDSVKENVRGDDNNLKGVTPGSSYSPVFMKAVFVEILNEQKVLHYQTENEADCTIAFIARKLENCPILSSDSDFHIYVNAITLPLHTLKFKKVTPSKKIQQTPIIVASDSSSPLSPTTNSTNKMWVLYSEYVSLPKLCLKEFGLTDSRFLPLAAVILGNDWIETNTFSNFHSNTGGNDVRRRWRILFILKWLGRQKSYARVFHGMLATIEEDKKKETSDLVNEIVSIYQGLGGEEKVWEMLMETSNVDKFLHKEDNSAESELLVGDLLEKLSLNESLELENPNISLNNFDNNISESQSQEDDEGNDSAAEEEENDDSEEFEVNTKLNKKLPEWYLESHRKGMFATYLLKLARNRMVFLSPQVELRNRPSSHAISIPIIQVLGGILLGSEELVTLVSRRKSEMEKVNVETVNELKLYGLLPTIKEDSSDFRETLSLETRTQIILETLGIYNELVQKFINEWPVSLRIWIVALIYFIQKVKEENQERQESKTAIPVALSILMSVIKNAVLNSNSVSPNEKDMENVKISTLLSQSNPLSLSNLRKFYSKYELVTDVSSKTFSRSYDITRAYNLSQYTCILYHLSQLNRLLGDPFRAPRLSYNLNNWFVYNLSSEITNENVDNQLDYGNVIEDLCGVKDMGTIAQRILNIS